MAWMSIRRIALVALPNAKEDKSGNRAKGE
jgi:hypothetical protein